MTARSVINFPAPADMSAQPAALAASGAHREVVPALQVYPGAFKPLSREDVAGILGISIRTLENWVKQGRLPAPASIAGRRYWHPERFYAALDALLQQGGSDQASQSSLVPPAAQVAPTLAKTPSVPSSTAGQRAKQASQDTSQAMLREATAHTKALATARNLA